MDLLQVFIAISVLFVLVIVLLLIFADKNKRGRNLTFWTALAFGFILAGIVFGGNRLSGYCLTGIGIILALISYIVKTKNRKK